MDSDESDVVKKKQLLRNQIRAKLRALSEDEIRAHCKAHLTGYKIPKTVEFRDELPKSNVGKILRKDLRAEDATQHAAE